MFCSISNFGIHGKWKTWKNKKVKVFVLGNTRSTVCEVGNILEILCGWFKSISNDNLITHWVATKFVPNLLSDEWKENTVNTCKYLQVRLERDP